MPSSLTGALSPAVSQNARARGADYYNRGAVTRISRTDRGIVASVRGTGLYVVSLEFEGPIVKGSCTCVYFCDRFDLCKHIWATALACDAQGLETLPPDTPAHAVSFEPMIPEFAIAEADDAPHRTLGGRSALTRQLRSPQAVWGRPPTPRKAPDWRQALDAIGTEQRVAAIPFARLAPPPTGRLIYVIDLAASQQDRAIVLHVMTQDRKKNGDWSVAKVPRLIPDQFSLYAEHDRAILERLVGARLALQHHWASDAHEIAHTRRLTGWLALDLLPDICATNRCMLAQTQMVGERLQNTVLSPIVWDAGAPWQGHLRVTRDDTTERFVVEGELRRDAAVLPLSDVVLLTDGGVVLTWRTLARYEAGPESRWLRELRRRTRIVVPVGEATALREALLQTPPAHATLPDELRTEILRLPAVPRLTLTTTAGAHQTEGTLAFRYGTVVVGADVDRDGLVPSGRPGSVIARDADAEDAARASLASIGVRPSMYMPGRPYTFPGTAPASRIIATLLEQGFEVHRADHAYRLPDAQMALRISSGIDWFDVEGEAAFGDQHVGLPALLTAIDRGDDAIPLTDGSIGILTDEWRRRYSVFGFGKKQDGRLRFASAQAALLDALLAEQPAVSADEAFERARLRVRDSQAIAPIDAPEGFTGTLRGYQREGLGWMRHLQALGFGGCLADDMGLGKTVMVLAMLEQRRSERAATGTQSRPSLVVVPRSVIFNWREEAARFTPALRVLDYSTADRRQADALIEASDLVLTTYGTLRKDAPHLSTHTFDCLILDEAQTIKNASTVTSKAARLLNAEHRLALSGTPVENRLADLWSIFEFLNPGLLANASRFTRTLANPDADQLRVLGLGLRPFILRRTKEQVATDLPPKVEQTIHCELDKKQRALYDELRDHYRQRLLNGRGAWERTRIQVLEALLRLRQAACHPALVNPEHRATPSAKLDLLVPRLVELADERHKTLVFSQFTSFLALLREELDAKGLTYEYLDGKTRDRETPVQRFQQDPDCRLFLISLKAGGLGLNLTAADYVFLLDPWWNPAVEAQAIDRSHRIGQTRHVFAYRLVARDTVEERVLELQQRKKQLADAILSDDNSVLKNLTREDLELLLS